MAVESLVSRFRGQPPKLVKEARKRRLVEDFKQICPFLELDECIGLFCRVYVEIICQRSIETFQHKLFRVADLSTRAAKMLYLNFASCLIQGQIGTSVLVHG